MIGEIESTGRSVAYFLFSEKAGCATGVTHPGNHLTFFSPIPTPFHSCSRGSVSGAFAYCTYPKLGDAICDIRRKSGVFNSKNTKKPYCW